jgi:hypothetical protein
MLHGHGLGFRVVLLNGGMLDLACGFLHRLYRYSIIAVAFRSGTVHVSGNVEG